MFFQAWEASVNWRRDVRWNFWVSETRMISMSKLKAFGFVEHYCSSWNVMVTQVKRLTRKVNDGSLFVEVMFRQCFRNVLQCLVREIERSVSWNPMITLCTMCHVHASVALGSWKGEDMNDVRWERVVGQLLWDQKFTILSRWPTVHILKNCEASVKHRLGRFWIGNRL